MPLATNGNVYTSTVTGTPEQVNSGSGYWTGHYTTRPLMKGLVARADGAKHTSEIAAALSCGLGRNSTLCGTTWCGDDLYPDGTRGPDASMMIAREVTSVLQHHDNIPGTSSPDAALNLDLRLRASLVASDAVLRKAAGAVAAETGTVTTDDLSGVRRLLQFGDTIVLFNPRATTRSEFVEFELSAQNRTLDRGGCSSGTALLGAVVIDASSGATVPSVTIPPIPQPVGVCHGDGFVNHRSTVVINTTLHKLSYRAFTVSAGGGPVASWSCGMVGALLSSTSIGGPAGSVSVDFDKATGRMSKVKSVDGSKTSISQEFSLYHASPGSDAYQFHPDRSKYAFGESLSPTGGGNSTKMQLRGTIKTALVERASQLSLTGLGPPPPPPPKKPDPQNGIDCSTLSSCKKTCPHMSECGDGSGVYYCCGTHGKHMRQCSGVHPCGLLHDCACNAPAGGGATPPNTRLLAETVSVFSGAVGVETKTEFTILTQDRELVTRYATDIDNTIDAEYFRSGGVSAKLPVFETDSNGMLMMRRVTNQTYWNKNASCFRKVCNTTLSSLFSPRRAHSVLPQSQT